MKRLFLFLSILGSLVVNGYCGFPFVIDAGYGKTANRSFKIELSVGYLSGRTKSGGPNMHIGYRVSAKKNYNQFLTTGLPYAPQAAPGTRSIMKNVIRPGRDMVMEWTDATNMVPVQYNVYFGTNPLNLQQIATTNQTKHIVTELEYKKVYTWQIQAVDKFGRSTMSQKFAFSIAPWLEKFYAAPNPFKAGKEGTTFLFMMPGAGTAKLEIYAQPHNNLVFWANVEGLQNEANYYEYDGKDMNGDVLYNGVYMAIINMSGVDGNVSQKHKFMVVR